MKALVTTKCLNEIMKNGIQNKATFKYHNARWNQS
jgi:hypothetical protein